MTSSKFLIGAASVLVVLLILHAMVPTTVQALCGIQWRQPRFVCEADWLASKLVPQLRSEPPATAAPPVSASDDECRDFAATAEERRKYNIATPPEEQALAQRCQ